MARRKQETEPQTEVYDIRALYKELAEYQAADNNLHGAHYRVFSADEKDQNAVIWNNIRRVKAKLRAAGVALWHPSAHDASLWLQIHANDTKEISGGSE